MQSCLDRLIRNYTDRACQFNLIIICSMLTHYRVVKRFIWEMSYFYLLIYPINDDISVFCKIIFCVIRHDLFSWFRVNSDPYTCRKFASRRKIRWKFILFSRLLEIPLPLKIAVRNSLPNGTGRKFHKMSKVLLLCTWVMEWQINI